MFENIITFKINGPAKLVVTAVAIAIVLIIMAASLACAPVANPAPAPAQATPDSATATATATPASTPGPVAFADPPGDCWGGALSADPVHCHVLEELQRDDLIEVEAMYVAGASLQVFFQQAIGVATDPDSQRFPEVMAEIAMEFAVKNPDKVNLDNIPVDIGCGGWASENEVLECLFRETFNIDFGGTTFIPWWSGYDRIEMHPARAEVRKAVGGWASWRQVWPEPQPSGGTQTGPGSTPGAAYDVSGVDTTNIPEVDCRETDAEPSCDERNRYPGFEIVGSHWAGGPIYDEVKAAPGKEEEVTAALKAEYTRLGFYTDAMIVIIPAKYSFDEYWKWAVILDRFARSSGNTIGLRGAEVGSNRGAFHEVIYPLPNLGPSRAWDKSDMRTTIEVWGYDVRVMADALPTLLPLLGIPVDAVGVVATIDESIWSPVAGGTAY